MNRLNYFHPYQSRTGQHEDHLTRAYLVILKHSSHAFFTFMEYCRSAHTINNDETSFSVNEFLERGWEIETQKGNPEIHTKYLLSVLITDSAVPVADSPVQPSERNARYDGIVTFGDQLTMIIENKPRSGNVWFGQLSPSRQNLAAETIVYSSPVVLEWKEIIKQLNHVLMLPTMAGGERIMIEDFLSFVDGHFPHLNPYDSFHQCKGNAELINRRIFNLLKSIALDENKINYHRGWGYYIHTPFREVRQIGLILSQSGNDQHLELSLYFGDTQDQAKAFHSANPDVSHLQDAAWSFWPNFHLAFMTSNLVGIESENTQLYLKYWKDNIHQIHQRKKDDVRAFLEQLIDEKVVTMPKEKEEELDKKFFNTAIPTLNICPGFAVIYRLNFPEAEKMDKGGRLKFLLAEKVTEALRVGGLDANQVLKKL